MNKKPIYLDYNATAPMKDAPRTLMSDLLGTVGNASSVHAFGREARKHIENARGQVAVMTGVQGNQGIFTSGATESNNAVMNAFKGENIWISAIEHPAVREAAPDAAIIPVDETGTIDMKAFEAMLEKGPLPALVSVMLVNNETGAIQPVGEIARLARRYNKDVFIHTDAVQAAGRMPIDLPALQVDYMSLSAHKMGGPQGVGALVTAPGARPAKLLYGGGQEKSQRAGTENVAGIAAFGLAAELAMADMDKFQALTEWRDRIESELSDYAPELTIFGKGAERVSNTTVLSLPGMPAETQLMNLDLSGIAVSTGSACSSGTVKPSRTLLAMGASDEQAKASLRISMGWDTTETEIDEFIAVWKKIYDRVREKLTQSAGKRPV